MCITCLVLSGCTDEGKLKPPLSKLAHGIADLFESDAPYSALVLDSADVHRFLRANKRFQADSSAILDFYRGRDMHFAWFMDDGPDEAVAHFLNTVDLTDTAASTAHADLGRELRTLRDALARLDTVPLTYSARTATELLLTAQFYRIARAEYGGLAGDHH